MSAPPGTLPAGRTSRANGAAAPAELRPLERVTLPGARRDRLYFAQVREDPTLELDALQLTARDRVVIVSSGGCTALSLLGSGAEVVAVDLNATQNDLVELKAAAIAALARPYAIAFLGAAEMPAERRLALYEALRPALTPAARAMWDARRSDVARGVLHCGVSERFIRALVLAVRLGIHPRRRMERLLACGTLEEQRALYEREWNTRRWRWLFRAALGRRALQGVYDPAFFAHAERPSFGLHFHRLVELTLTTLPVADNYFLHDMLAGRYPADVPGGVPPYLDASGGAATRAARARLQLVDAPLTEYLRVRPSRSVTAFAISNIGEWLAPPALDALFGEIVRTAAPGARLCFRNFVGWTEVPARWAPLVREDRAAGEALIRRDRSAVQRRIAVCRIREDA